MRILDDAAALAREGARTVADAAARAVEARGRFALVLAGGSTPRRLYETLVSEDVPWSAVSVYFGDERCVAPDDPASNHRMAREALLDHVAPAAVHRIGGELPPAEAAALYEAEVSAAGRFDLVLLGLGTDGHTASLFPGGPELAEERRLVVPTRSPVPPHDRVSLTLPAINAAREVVFLVSGEEKSSVLAEVLGGADLPAAMVGTADAEPVWLVDRAAAKALGGERRTV